MKPFKRYIQKHVTFYDPWPIPRQHALMSEIHVRIKSDWLETLGEKHITVLRKKIFGSQFGSNTDWHVEMDSWKADETEDNHDRKKMKKMMGKEDMRRQVVHKMPRIKSATISYYLFRAG